MPAAGHRRTMAGSEPERGQPKQSPSSRLAHQARQASGFRPSCEEEALWMLREHQKRAEELRRALQDDA